MSARGYVQKTVRLFSQPVILFYALPWLMILLIAGTLAQKHLGLYAATQQYLTAPFFWVGGIVPLPGVPVVLGIILVNLLFKLFFKSPWTPQNAGIIITHFGAAFLFLGMMLTAFFSEEGYISLAEGERTAAVNDYYLREFTVLKDGKPVYTLSYDALYPGKKIRDDTLPFAVEILDLCRNCTMAMQEEESGDSTPRHGLAQQVRLVPAPLEKTEETNLAGAMLHITGADQEQDGIHISFEPLQNPPQITDGEDAYTILMRRIQTGLPFSIQLVDVVRTSYPGTQMPQSYHSDVIVHDGDVSWQTRIEMNAPLRYKGYTFYQSGYTLHDGQEFTTLAVVKNAGRAFPYIAGLFLSLGMAVHAVLRIRTKKSGGQDRAF
ncbi:MAG: hypothetical protein EA357_09500 [Micavibrio sp.]|nr:MAG: hypothetical protein EA357_09500 [Micavibrio sp.]